jgi:protein tyrosine kinase
MSPEQSRAFPLDRRSDIFSAGILLWELTTGRRLYRGASDFDVLKAIIEGDAPPPSSVKHDYPRPLEKIVMRALRRNREERWQTAQEMQLALEEFARERRMQISPVALANYLRDVCAERIAAWEQALATRSGIVDHIAGTMMSISETPWLESSGEVMAIKDAPTVAERTPSAVLPANFNLRPSRRRWWIVGASALIGLAAAIAIISRPTMPKPSGISPALPAPLSPPPVVEPVAPKVAPVAAPAPKAEPKVESEQPPSPKPKPPAAKPKAKRAVAKPPAPRKRVDLDSPLPP